MTWRSFSYVLLWMCVRQSWHNGFAQVDEQRVKISRMRNWEVGSFRDIADAKLGHMSAVMLRIIVQEMPKALACVQPLCLEIGRILFPLNEELEMQFGTPQGDAKQLYDPILQAYGRLIDELS